MSIGRGHEALFALQTRKKLGSLLSEIKKDWKEEFGGCSVQNFLEATVYHLRSQRNLSINGRQTNAEESIMHIKKMGSQNSDFSKREVLKL